MRSLAPFAFALAASAPLSAAADPPSPDAPALTFRAGSLEAEGTRVELRDHVEIAYGRYRLLSDDLTIEQRPGVVALDGTLHLAPCPCPDPPVTLGVSGARLYAGGDVGLVFPRLEIERVPVFALPYLLLRPPDKPGLLPPIVEVRGPSGLLLGGGARMPFGGDRGAVELTAAGFVEGGVEMGARLETPISSTRFVFDELDGERAVVLSRGAVSLGPRAELAWDGDAIRGDRGIAQTPDLFDATRPFDTLAAEVSRFAPAGDVTGGASAGVVARGVRGDGELLAGPHATASFGAALGSAGAASASSDLGVFGSSTGSRTTIATAMASAEIDPKTGPFDVRLATRARARTAEEGDDDPSREGSFAGTATLGLPFVKRFAASEGDAPLMHLVEPDIEVGAAAGDRHGDFFLPVFGPIPTSAWEIGGGVSTSFGSYAGPSVKLEARGGGAAFDGGAPAAMGLARLFAEAPIVAARASVAAIGPRPAGDGSGFSAVAKLRVGKLVGPSLELDVAGQVGPGAADARLLDEGLLGEPRLAWFSADGWTGGAEAHVPITRAWSARARIDLDLQAETLLEASGALRYASPCGCFGVEIGGGHREGRDGLDGFVSIDLTPRR